jgi:Zn-dependent peptidase ImmA (M78 family)
MASGIYGNNSHRKLNVDEFRGFTLSDNLAPLIFINSNDSKSAQIFTLAHELAHVWLGHSGISNPEPSFNYSLAETEKWCNRVAAELLVPAESLKQQVNSRADITVEYLIKLSNIFNVSSLVMLISIYHLKLINKNFYNLLWKRLAPNINKNVKMDAKNTGSDFFILQQFKLGNNFLNALLDDVLRGETMYLEAAQLVSVRKVQSIINLINR